MSRERTSGSTGRSLSNVFNVYHGRDKKPENKYTWCWWRPFDWPSVQAPWPPKDQKPQGPSFKCGLEGHWAWACLNSNKPPGYVQSTIKESIGVLTAPMLLKAWRHQAQITSQLIWSWTTDGPFALRPDHCSLTRSLRLTSQYQSSPSPSPFGHWGLLFISNRVLGIHLSFSFLYCQVRVMVLPASSNISFGLSP